MNFIKYINLKKQIYLTQIKKKKMYEKMLSKNYIKFLHLNILVNCIIF